jgi:DNA-3-methyladenine glycosylase
MAFKDRLNSDFFTRDVLEVAPEVLGKILVIRLKDGTYLKSAVTDIEAYRGTDDKACHASKGRTARTEIMFHKGGYLYVYLVYGMYWMLNVVTGLENDPQAILIRGIENCTGPGRVAKFFCIDGSFYGEDLSVSERIWFENAPHVTKFSTGNRIGIDYAGEYWRTRPWRYYI